MEAYLDVILPFVSQTSSFDSPNSLYLKIYLDLSNTIVVSGQMKPPVGDVKFFYWFKITSYL